jgi:hypothetical protein
MPHLLHSRPGSLTLLASLPKPAFHVHLISFALLWYLLHNMQRFLIDFVKKKGLKSKTKERYEFRLCERFRIARAKSLQTME